MKLFLDTEFNGFGGSLISIALVSEAGHEWYQVLNCRRPTDWVRRNVMPVLNQAPTSPAALRASLRSFFDQFNNVHIVADWPEDISHLCRQLVSKKGHQVLTPPMTLELLTIGGVMTTSATPHNALSDARALRVLAGTGHCLPRRLIGAGD